MNFVLFFCTSPINRDKIKWLIEIDTIEGSTESLIDPSALVLLIMKWLNNRSNSLDFVSSQCISTIVCDTFELSIELFVYIS